MSSGVDFDSEAREAALDVGQSILLQAPAGSGKTEVLTQRFLALLGVVDEPEEILAITFTRKAAAEMRRRILSILDGDIDPERPTARRLVDLRERALARASHRGWDLLELRSRLRIQTIDSLNHELARSMPLDGHGGATLAVVEDADALHLEAARRALSETALDDDPGLRDALDLVLRRLDNQTGRAESLLAGMLARRAQWLPALTQHSPAELARVVERSLEAIATEAIARVDALLPAAWKRRASALLRTAASALAAEGRPSATLPWLEVDAALETDVARLAEWRALGDLLLTNEHEWRKALTKNHGFPPAAKPAKQDAMELIADAQRLAGLQGPLRDLRELPTPELGADETRALGALAIVLRRAALALQQVFASEGRVDHTAIAGFARQGLGGIDSPSDLALRRAAALKHLLVDEFQDTSVEQLALLERLTLGWEPDDGRSLFAVGDPMQSIYQFRSAEVGLFLRARDRGIGELRLAPHRLTRNFRSSAALIGWCNAAFDAIFPRRDDVRESAVAFLPADAGRASEPVTDPAHLGVVVTALPDREGETEAELLAASVVDARERDPDCSVAVLVQSSSVAPPIIAALQGRGLAVRGVDLEPLSRQPAVRDVVSLGCALLHPLDRIAWYSVLRAPHVGLSLEDLLVLAEQGGPLRSVLESLSAPEVFAALSDDARRRLARCLPLLATAVEHRSRGSLVTELRELWERIGAPAALRDAAESVQVDAWFSALARREAEGVRLDGDVLRELAEKLRVGAESAAPRSVEILTIHKAKGLEWDVVLLPGLHRMLRGDARPLLAWIELPRPDRDADLLLASLSIGRASENDRLAAYIATMRRRRQVHERCRLAYVAATRARRELHLFAYAAPDAEGRPRPRPNTMLHTLWPALADRFEGQPVAVGHDAEMDAPAVAERLNDGQGAWWRLPVDWSPPVEPPAIPVPRLSGSPEANEEPPPEFIWVGREARAVGTVVHAELERLARVGSPLLDAAAARRASWPQRLRELGVPADRVAPAIERVSEILQAVAADERARWILSPSHPSADCELRLSGVVDGELRDVVIDRTFVDAKGERWIVDYKTGSHEGGDLEAFVAQELDRYAPQLRLYRRLARGLGPEPVRCALYFPLLGRFAELPR